MIILQMVFVLLAIVIFCLLGVMLLPINYKFYGGYRENFFFGLQSSVAGIIGIKLANQGSVARGTIKIFGCIIPFELKDQHSSNKKKTPKEEKKQDKSSAGETVKLLIDKAFLKEGFSLVKDILKIIAPDVLRLEGKIGLDEPHQTGWILGLAATLNATFKPVQIDLIPIWDEEYIEIEGTVEGRLVVGVIIVRALRFVFSKSARKVWKKIYRLNKKHKSLQQT